MVMYFDFYPEAGGWLRLNASYLLDLYLVHKCGPSKVQRKKNVSTTHTFEPNISLIRLILIM